jgi:hypothetical protein
MSSALPVVYQVVYASTLSVMMINGAAQTSFMSKTKQQAPRQACMPSPDVNHNWWQALESASGLLYVAQVELRD